MTDLLPRDTEAHLLYGANIVGVENTLEYIFEDLSQYEFDFLTEFFEWLKAKELKGYGYGNLRSLYSLFWREKTAGTMWQYKDAVQKRTAWLEIAPRMKNVILICSAGYSNDESGSMAADVSDLLNGTLEDMPITEEERQEYLSIVEFCLGHWIDLVIFTVKKEN